MGREQLRRLKGLEKGVSLRTRLRRAVSDLTLDTLILAEAAKGNVFALALRPVAR